jgi:hypothetical protein
MLLIYLPLLLSQKRRETTGTVVTPKLNSFMAIRIHTVEIIVEGIYREMRDRQRLFVSLRIVVILIFIGSTALGALWPPQSENASSS